jgi:c-di-GMP-binding flagellar brake protein YcgR
MATAFNIPGSEINIGNRILVHVADDKQVNTTVQIMEDNSIWTADILVELVGYQWRNRAFDVSYIKNTRMFSFLTEIEGHEKIKGVPYTKLNIISGVQEVQRRASYRLRYTFDVYLRNRAPKYDHGAAQDSENADRFIKCKGLDISETGMGLTSAHNWNTGEQVECKFGIDGETYTFFATIMRKLLRVTEEKAADQDPYIYRLGVMFHEGDDRLLRKIRRFVLRRQVSTAR